MEYLQGINKNLPKDIFENSERISQIAKSIETPTKGGDRPGVAPVGVVGRICEANPSPAIGLVGVSKENKNTQKTNVVVGVSESKNNYAVKLAEIALQITKDNKERHNIIENFMLINDTATIVVEVPIYLTNDESPANKPLTGHIDILQIRYHKIYILDYKPEPVNIKQTISQLRLYQRALSQRTQIPKHKFKLAFFNDK